MRTQVLGGTTYTYDYDFTGKRVKRASSGGSVYWYIFDGERLVGEIGKASSGATPAATVAYTWGADGLAIERSISSSSSLYYYFGPQGETRYLKDGSGTTQNTYVYSAYGLPIASTGSAYNRHRYGGKVGYFTDGPSSSVLILATNRWYNPEVRRWLSRDPIEYEGGENLYEYVSGRPIKFIDPTGLEECKLLPIWTCERPVRGWKGKLLPNHKYVCCKGPNLDCYGHSQNDAKKGELIPKEAYQTGRCTESSVCEDAFNAKCDKPISPCDMGTFTWNCRHWADWDGKTNPCP